MGIPESVLGLFPDPWARVLRSMETPDPVEELRCRVGRSVSVCAGNRMRETGTPAVTAEQLDSILERAANASLYAHGEELRRGFLHTVDGCRIGVCGTYYQNGTSAGIRQITSLSIRIAREIRGCADDIFSQMRGEPIRHTLILSPPGCGKTTLLRDLIRRISDSGVRVSVADERGELAGTHDRMQGFDIGRNTDVISGGCKRDTAMMLLRAMNPQVLAFDEITSREDLEVIREAAGCGASLIATAHARDRASLRERALYRDLLNDGIFEQAIWIRQNGSQRSYSLEPLR